MVDCLGTTIDGQWQKHGALFRTTINGQWQNMKDCLGTTTIGGQWQKHGGLFMDNKTYPLVEATMRLPYISIFKCTVSETTLYA
jgi:hypothetical protein